MSYVDLSRHLPVADPVDGFVLHCKQYMFGVQILSNLPEEIVRNATCPITMSPLSECAKVGALVWAKKKDIDEEKKVEWKFVCIEQGVNDGKIHVFDFDTIRGYVESEKEFTTCPLCKRGSGEKPKVSQIDVSFTEDLLAQRSDLLNLGSPDLQMALFYETQIVRQVVLNDEVKHKAAVLDMVRNWDSANLEHQIEPTLQVCFEKDRMNWLHEFLKMKPALRESQKLLMCLEQACRYEAASMIEDLVGKFNPPVSKYCFEYLIGHRNEYLLDLVLNHYAKWIKEAPLENHLRHDDWINLGKFAVLRREFPVFVKSVQQKNIFRLLDKIRSDDSIPSHILQEQALGLVHQESDKFGSLVQEDDWDDWDEAEAEVNGIEDDWK